jgi:hypothetical protein
MTSKKFGPCPSCVFVEHYNKDGSFAAYMDYQHKAHVFMRQVKGIVELLLTGTFEEGVGIRMPKRHRKAYDEHLRTYPNPPFSWCTTYGYPGD